jgi:hypothetical protein
MTTPELLALYEVSSDADRSVLSAELFIRLSYASTHRGDVNLFSPKNDR